jgi:hypothetical protein
MRVFNVVALKRTVFVAGCHAGRTAMPRGASRVLHPKCPNAIPTAVGVMKLAL